MTNPSSIVDGSYPPGFRGTTPFFVANALLSDRGALRARLEADGYLFFKSVIPTDALRTVHQDFRCILETLEVVHAECGDDPMKAACKPFREGEQAYFDVHDQLYTVESFHRLVQHPALMQVVREVLGDTAFPHPLAILRLIFPENLPVTTPPHQDFPNNQGSKNLTAAWIPLTDCPARLGPLAVLSGSHKFGVMPLQHHLGAGNRAAKLDPCMDQLEWHGGDFELGDILLFSALTVHSATHNLDPTAMRISVDFRYQVEGEPLTEQCLEPHFGRLSWDKIYKGWQRNDLNYYWRDKRFDVVPWDPALQQISEKDAAAGMKAALKYAVDRGDLKFDISSLK